MFEKKELLRNKWFGYQWFSNKKNITIDAGNSGTLQDAFLIMLFCKKLD